LGSEVDSLWTLIGHGPLNISTELVFRILIVGHSKDWNGRFSKEKEEVDRYWIIGLRWIWI